MLDFISNIPNDIPLGIRPHPFESSSYYQFALPKYYSVELSSVKFITDTDIHDDLSSISLSFNSGCQSTLDSIIRGVIKYGIISTIYIFHSL